MASTSHLILPTAVRADFSRRREGPLCLPATIRNFPSPRRLLPHPLRASPPTLAAASTSSSLKALIFDCDGVILESEHLHRQAYNEAFAHFSVRCPVSSPKPLYWGSDFYDELQNRIGGGKPKMRWYFKENGWPSSSIYAQPPLTDSDRETLIDVIQLFENTCAIFLDTNDKLRPSPTKLHRTICRLSSAPFELQIVRQIPIGKQCDANIDFGLFTSPLGQRIHFK